MEFDEALASLPPDVAFALARAAGHGPESRRSRYRALAVEFAGNPERLSDDAEAVGPPSLARRAVNLAKAVGEIAASGVKMADPAEAARRLEACGGCELFDADKGICKHVACGCYMRTKVRFEAMKCPIGKW